jgi:spore germination cell wall hydrolase CwlJ-like protein
MTPSRSNLWRGASLLAVAALAAGAASASRPSLWTRADLSSPPKAEATLELFIPSRRSAGTNARRSINDSIRPSRFHLPASGAERERAEDCLTAAIYYEAANEPTAGQEAVAQVILNRMRHPAYPKSVCGVVYQGSERRTGCQFTFTCDGSLSRRPSASGWARAGAVAKRALSGHVADEVSSATHYHTRWISPYWSPSLIRLGEVGAHVFYRMPGTAAERAYVGGEMKVIRTAARTRSAGLPDATPKGAIRPAGSSPFTVWGLTVTPPKL